MLFPTQPSEASKASKSNRARVRLTSARLSSAGSAGAAASSFFSSVSASVNLTFRPDIPSSPSSATGTGTATMVAGGLRMILHPFTIALNRRRGKMRNLRATDYGITIASRKMNIPLGSHPLRFPNNTGLEVRIVPARHRRTICAVQANSVLLC